MPRPELFYFTLADADTHILEPNYCADEPYVFEYIPDVNDADGYMDEEDFMRQYRRGTTH